MDSNFVIATPGTGINYHSINTGEKKKMKIQVAAIQALSNDSLLTTNDVRALLGCSTPTVYKMVKSGKIRSTKFNGDYLIPGVELKKAIGCGTPEPENKEERYCVTFQFTVDTLARNKVEAIQEAQKKIDALTLDIVGVYSTAINVEVKK
jgi:excisionase family DNA binding protein